MKKIYSHSKYFLTKKNIFATLCALIISDFTFAQLSAEDSLFQEANYYLNTGYYESAINSLEKLLELNPNSAEAYGLLGNAFNKQGKYEKAIEMYHKCLEIDSTMLPVYENLGNAYIDAGKFSLAISLHKDLLSKDSTNIRHHINLGDAYMKNKDTTQAQLYFLKAVDLNPHSTLAHVNLAMTYFYQTKYKEAIDELFLVRNMDNWYPLLQNRLEVVTATAQSEFEQWVEREPANSEALYYLAFSVWYRDDCEDAIDEMEEIIELNDQVEKYYLTKAIWLNNQEEFEDAVEDCKKCLALNPDNWMCHNRIAFNYAILENWSAALLHHQRSLEIDSLVMESHYLLGISYYFKGDYFNAVQSLNKAFNIAINSGVKNPVICYFLAKAYYSLGDYENALQNATTAKYMDFPEEATKKNLNDPINHLLNDIATKLKQEPRKQ